MASVARELLAVDRQRVDLRAGVLGLVVLGVLAAAIAWVGPQALAAVIGALVMLSTDPPPAGRSRATTLLPLVVGGTVLTFVAVWIGGRAMMAVREANYTLFAMLVTTLVVYTQRILGADAAQSGRDRLAETILGVAIAFVVLGLTEALSRTRKQTR